MFGNRIPGDRVSWGKVPGDRVSWGKVPWDRVLGGGAPWSKAPGDRVPAAFTKGLAADQSIGGEHDADKKSSRLKGFYGVMRTRGMETAGANVERGLYALIHPNQKNGDMPHVVFPGSNPNRRSASARSSERRHWDAFWETSNTSQVACLRCGAAAWNEVRNVRRMEFRIGALPTFFRMIKPRRDRP